MVHEKALPPVPLSSCLVPCTSIERTQSAASSHWSSRCRGIVAPSYNELWTCYRARRIEYIYFTV